jgi:hypothetical protein
MRNFILTLVSLWFFISCEDSTYRDDDSQQNAILAMRMGGSGTSGQMAGTFSASYAGESSGITGQVSGVQAGEGYMDLDSSISGMSATDADPVIHDFMLNDMSLTDMSVISCSDNETRHRMICGIERCENGQWIEVASPEICNNWDDDCDEVVDEDPTSTNQSSECCTELNCMSRAYCVDGQCEVLRQNQCWLDGDCDQGHECINNACTPLYVINPPRASASCQMPIDATIGMNSENGHSASYLFSALRCSDEEFRVETARGPEMIFRVNILIQGRYAFFSKVSNNAIDLPSTISLLMSCNPTEQALWCYSTGTSGLTLGQGSVVLNNNVMVDLEPGEYFVVVDTHYQELYEEFSLSSLQLADINFHLTITQR